jgi:hypothetical protein
VSIVVMGTATFLVGLLPTSSQIGWWGPSSCWLRSACVIDKLNNEINLGLADHQIADFGGTVFALSPAGLGKFIADETEKWAKVIRAANIKPE